MKPIRAARRSFPSFPDGTCCYLHPQSLMAYFSLCSTGHVLRVTYIHHRRLKPVSNRGYPGHGRTTTPDHLCDAHFAPHQAVLGFTLPCAAVAAHLAALHKLTQSEGSQAVVGPPAMWCARVQAACEEVLAKAIDARGNMVSPLRANRLSTSARANFLCTKARYNTMLLQVMLMWLHADLLPFIRVRQNVLGRL